VAAFAGASATAEKPADPLRLTRLPGTEPAAFSVAAPDGTSLALGDLKGKVVLLNFWATWIVDNAFAIRRSGAAAWATSRPCSTPRLVGDARGLPDVSQAETGDSRRDSLDPDQVRYTVRSREISF
jgi:hypothetical protein